MLKPSWEGSIQIVQITVFQSSFPSFSVLLGWGLKLTLNTFYHHHLHLHKASGLCHPGYTVWRYLYVHSPIKVYQPREGDWREKEDIALQTQSFVSYIQALKWSQNRLCITNSLIPRPHSEVSFPGFILRSHSQTSFQPFIGCSLLKLLHILCSCGREPGHCDQ